MLTHFFMRSKKFLSIGLTGREPAKKLRKGLPPNGDSALTRSSKQMVMNYHRTPSSLAGEFSGLSAPEFFQERALEKLISSKKNWTWTSHRCSCTVRSSSGSNTCQNLRLTQILISN